jgi:hypothetical protein
MVRQEASTQEILNEALNDPNLTKEERRQIDEIQLNAMHKAKKIADKEENRDQFTEALQNELQKCSAEIQRIRGRAANRESRRVEDF